MDLKVITGTVTGKHDTLISVQYPNIDALISINGNRLKTQALVAINAAAKEKNPERAKQLFHHAASVVYVGEDTFGQTIIRGADLNA